MKYKIYNNNRRKYRVYVLIEKGVCYYSEYHLRDMFSLYNPSMAMYQNTDKDYVSNHSIMRAGLNRINSEVVMRYVDYDYLLEMAVSAWTDEYVKEIDDIVNWVYRCGERAVRPVKTKSESHSWIGVADDLLHKLNCYLGYVYGMYEGDDETMLSSIQSSMTELELEIKRYRRCMPPHKPTRSTPVRDR